MKRSGRLARHTALARDGDGARRFASKARKPIRSRSVKRQAARPAEEALTVEVFARDGGCVLRDHASHVCTGPLTPHHLRKASAGGAWTPDNIVALCAGANTGVEDDPPWGRHLGLVIRWDIPPAVAWQRRVDCGLVVRTDQPEDGLASVLAQPKETTP